MSFGAILTKNFVYRSLNIAVTLFITLLITRLMNAEGFGVLSLLIANASILSLVSCLGAESGITYHYASKTMSTGKLFSIIYIIIVFQLSLFGIIELIHHSISGHYWLMKGQEPKFFLLGLVYLFSVTMIDKYTAFYNGNHLYTAVNRIIFIINSITLLIFCSLYFFYIRRDLFFYLDIFILCTFVQAILLVFIFHIAYDRGFRFLKIEKNDWRVFFSYSFIVFLTNVIQFLAYRIDYWLVNYYHGEAALGVYSLAVKLGQLLWVLPILCASIVFPLVADKEKRYDEIKILALVRVTNTILFVAGIIALLTGAWAIPLFFGDSYEGSIIPFYYLLPGLFFFCTSIILAAYFAGRNQVTVNLVGSTLCFMLVLVLDLLLIPSMSVKGAAIASSIAYSFNAFYYLWKFNRQHKTRLLYFFVWKKSDKKYLFDLKENLANTGI